VLFKQAECGSINFLVNTCRTYNLHVDRSKRLRNERMKGGLEWNVELMDMERWNMDISFVSFCRTTNFSSLLIGYKIE